MVKKQKKETYETRKVREWKMKKPLWMQFNFFMWINMFIQFILFPNFNTYESRLIVFGIIFIVFYLLHGTYPYYRVKHITTKIDVEQKDGE